MPFLNTEQDIARIAWDSEQGLSQKQLEIGCAGRPGDRRNSGDDDQFVASDLTEADAIVAETQSCGREFLIPRNLHNGLVVSKIAKNRDGHHRGGNKHVV